MDTGSSLRVEIGYHPLAQGHCAAAGRAGWLFWLDNVNDVVMGNNLQD